MLWSLALDAIISYSNKPLRLSITLGIGICGITIAVVFYALWVWLHSNNPVSGWTSLILSVWFLGWRHHRQLGPC